MQQTERAEQHEHRNYQIHVSRQKIPNETMAQHLMHGRNLGLSVLLRSSYVPLFIHVRGEPMTQEDQNFDYAIQSIARRLIECVRHEQEANKKVTDPTISDQKQK